MIRVVVVDDQALVRAGFRVLVDSAATSRWSARPPNGAEAVDLVASSQPGRRADGHPDAGARRPRGHRGDHRARAAATRVLVLTTFDLDEYVFGALRAGASGFLLKDTPPTELLDGIRVVAAGEALLAPASPGTSSRSSCATAPGDAAARPPEASTR